MTWEITKEFLELQNAERRPSLIQPSPLPGLARSQVATLELIASRLDADALERVEEAKLASSRDRRMFALQLATFITAIATLIAAIIPLIH